MNNDQSLNLHSRQVEMVFSCEEAFSEARGSSLWVDCGGVRETDGFERLAEGLETTPLAEDLEWLGGKEARNNQSFGERNAHEEGRLHTV